MDSWILCKIIQLSNMNFCRRFLTRSNDPCGRQFDQTTQAARSAPANIAEGSARHSTSLETEMSLLDVARATIMEVIDDYMFFIMDHGGKIWDDADERAYAVRGIRLDPPNYGKSLMHDVSEHVYAQKKKFDPWVENADWLVSANAILVLCRRAEKVLRGQLERALSEFEQNGGFRENLTNLRLDAKRKESESAGAPRCPKCGAAMVLRTVTRGERIGSKFWGCSNYRTGQCNGVLPYKEA